MASGKTTLVAAKDLTIDGLTVKAGSTLATIEQGVPADRIFNGLSNGAVIDKAEYDRRAAESAAARSKTTDSKPTVPPPPAVPL